MTKVTHLTLDEGGGLSRKRIHLREISGDADAPLETVGQDLREARLRRGDDLATVSKALKIRKDHLEALEEDRFDSLPGRTYAIGFVRSYAEYLGLEPVECVERFKSEIAGRDDTPKPPVFQETGDERRLPHGWVIIAIVVVGLVFYGAYRLARSANSLLDEPVAPVPSRMAPPAEKTAPAQPAETASVPGTVPPAPSASAALQQPNIVAFPPPGQNPAPPTPQTASAPSGGHVYGLRNADARVILTAVKPVKVLIEGDNGTIYINRTLKAGDSYRVPDLVGLSLSTPDASALEIQLDGQRMGRVGAPQHIAEALSLDPQAIVDRYNSAGQ